MNTIENWSWEKPTEPGDYLVSYGDVVSSPFFIRVMDFQDELLIVEGEENAGARVLSNMVDGHKFARLDYK